jgi:hypothetical protein
LIGTCAKQVLLGRCESLCSSFFFRKKTKYVTNDYQIMGFLKVKSPSSRARLKIKLFREAGAKWANIARGAT